MKVKAFLFAIAFFFAAIQLQAQQPVDGIIAAYFEAIGGADKIAQINSIYIEGNLQMMGSQSPMKVTILNGKGYKTEMNFGGSDVVQTITDNGGWMINPFMGSPEPVPLPNEQYVALKQQIHIGGPLFKYSTNGYRVNFAGMDVLDGKAEYKVDAVSPDSVKNTFYIDSVTDYVDQLSINNAGQTITVKYSNYKKTDFGNLMPFKEQIISPEGSVDIT
ncbi:MAG TPA: hypothetical protein VEV83_19095, partial [Parafilimonas sp.]|nr:hypothetical protein [Parafilimonas sp.]